MLRKLRRSSKELVEISTSRSREATGNAQSADTASSQNETTRCSFFDLPAEIRNVVYEFVVCDITLSLPSSTFTASKKSKLSLKRRKSIAAPINGLLLTSRQCRQEYLSILLSTASVNVEVKDFDFESLIRVSSSLDSQDLQHLQLNPNLTLLLITQNCPSKAVASLRRWLNHRRDSEVNLPWKYEFPLEKLLPPTTMGRVRLLRELEYYADNISILAVDVEEPQYSELQSIVEAFRTKASWLEDDLGWLGQRSKSVSQNLRGLAGGGVM